MLFFLFLLNYFINLFAFAAPYGSPNDAAVEAGKTLNPRQVLIADPSISCCTSCGAKYSYETFYNVFDNFCGWAGNGLELWTGQSYYTQSYYCEDGASSCIHLMVKYRCGDGSAYAMDYLGCMSYFEYVIHPDGICGGPPYPGARIESGDKCWIFQATADTPGSAVQSHSFAAAD